MFERNIDHLLGKLKDFYREKMEMDKPRIGFMLALKIALLHTLIGAIRIEGILIVLVPKSILFIFWLSGLISYKHCVSSLAISSGVLVSIAVGSVLAHIFCELLFLGRKPRALIWVVISFGSFYLFYDFGLIGLFSHNSEFDSSPTHIASASFIFLTVLILAFMKGEQYYDDLYAPSVQTEEYCPIKEALIDPDLISAQSSNQYVILRFSQREERHRIKFCDVLQTLEKVPGCRIHRSFWVSLKHMGQPVRVGRSWKMTVCGRNLPVSGQYIERIMSLPSKTEEKDRRIRAAA